MTLLIYDFQILKNITLLNLDYLIYPGFWRWLKDLMFI